MLNNTNPKHSFKKKISKKGFVDPPSLPHQQTKIPSRSRLV